MGKLLSRSEGGGKGGGGWRVEGGRGRMQGAKSYVSDIGYLRMSLHCTDMGVALSTGAPVESCDMGVVSALFRWPRQFIFPGTYVRLY